MVNIEPGVYIIAVSGGADSVVLLNMLSKQKDLNLIVAHFNHGIRNNSIDDEIFVKNLAKTYALKFESKRGRLGKNASEAEARKSRYAFLEIVKNKYSARAIITAHHQDDLIETAFINIIRGTDRRGLASLKSSPTLLRPLLNMTKKQIINYAITNKLEWREDPTNLDKKHLRNKIRLEVIPIINDDVLLRQRLLDIISSSQELNQELDKETEKLSKEILATKNNRLIFVSLPAKVANEIAAEMLRIKGVKDINKRMVYDLATNIKTGKSGKIYEVKEGVSLTINKNKFMFVKTSKSPLI